MSATFGNTTVNGVVTQTGNGTASDDLLRKAQIEALIAAIATHAAVTKADSTTIAFTLSGQQLSASVILDGNSSGLAVGAAGLRVANNTFAAFGHSHDNANTSTAGFMSAADKQKLNGIPEGATANANNTYLLDRTNHTGNQVAATISDFASAVAAIALSKTGGTLTGNLSFSGNAAMQLPAFSAAEIGNLTWSERMVIYNETANTTQIYLGSAWHVFQIGNGSGGGVDFDDVTGAISIAANGTSTLANTTIGVQHFAAWQPGDFLVGPASVAGNPRIVQPSVVRALLNVADGATANANNTYLLDRTNHTGAQPASSIANFTAEVQAVALANPMTTAGDLIYGGANGTPTRLPKGANGTWLSIVAGNVAWATLGNVSAANFTGNGATALLGNGGFGAVGNASLNGNGSVVLLGNGSYALDTRTGVYRTLWIGAGAMVARTTNGAATATVELPTNDVMLDLYDFANGTDQATQFVAAMPDEWDRGAVKAKIYWTAANGTGGVAWGVRAQAGGDNDSLDTAFGTEVVVTDTFLSANKTHITSATGNITIGGSPALGDLVLWEVTRKTANASDTLTGLGRVIGLAIQYKESTTEPAAW